MSESLSDLQRRIDDLAAPDGAFHVACPDAGDRPVPLKGMSFAAPEDAERAVDLAREYRERLRETDPHLDRRRFVATERLTGLPSFERSADGDSGQVVGPADRTPDAARSVTLSGDGDGEWLRMDDAPVVRIRRDGEPVDDAVIAYQLDVEL